MYRNRLYQRQCGQQLPQQSRCGGAHHAMQFNKLSLQKSGCISNKQSDVVAGTLSSLTPQGQRHQVGVEC
jgi:hypothetical protein